MSGSIEALKAQLRSPDGRERLDAAAALWCYHKLGDDHEWIGGWITWSHAGVLRVGCEVHSFDEWIERADEITASNDCQELAGPIRRLARKLLAAQTPFPKRTPKPARPSYAHPLMAALAAREGR